MEGFTCRLPGGYIDRDGVVHREAELVPLSGREEELLAGNHRLEPASLVTQVLSRCVQRIGTIAPVSTAVARSLLVADRQFLLLKLRETTFGDCVQATLHCPWPGCGAKMDMSFSLHDIPIVAPEAIRPTYLLELPTSAAYEGDDGEAYTQISFRLPNGEDQEQIAPLLAENEAQALTLLLARCIDRIGPWQHPGLEMVSRLSAAARQEIENAMAAAAPQIDLTMEAHCAECGRGFVLPFDLHDFFFGELRISRDLLYREVHYLAYHYHWSEREIMEMPRTKRRTFIEVLADEIERLNDAS